MTERCGICLDHDLLPLNKFKISCRAKRFFSFVEASELDIFARSYLTDDIQWLVLGGGSNILLTEDPAAWVIHPRNELVEIHLSTHCDSVIVRAYAGLSWDALVKDCAAKGWSGIENLTSIPGSVGAAPVQNIGAYGSEVSDCVVSVACYDILRKTHLTLTRDACGFAYRSSIFKRRPELVVLSVDLRLAASMRGRFRGEVDGAIWPAVGREISKLVALSVRAVRFGPRTGWRIKMNFENVRKILSLRIIGPSIKRLIVKYLRQKTMPDPAEIGNVGCFFKSPIVGAAVAAKVSSHFPTVQVFPCGDELYKISAGDLIREVGWAGRRRGSVSTDHRRPLVILNHGGASGEEILAFAKSIQDDVYEKCCVAIEPEVVIV